MIATFRRAGLAEFEQHFRDPRVVAFRERVRMVLDPEVDAAYPQRWIGKVDVETTDGRTLTGRVDEPKGDPGNTLSRAEIEDKALRLADWSGARDARRDARASRSASSRIADAPTVGILVARPATRPARTAA